MSAQKKWSTFLSFVFVSFAVLLWSQTSHALRIELKPQVYLVGEVAGGTTQRYDTHNYYLGGRFEGWRDAMVWLGGRQLSKVYKNGGPTLTDTILESGTAIKFTEYSYMAADLKYAPDAIFSSRFAIGADPHFNFQSGWDVGCRVGTSEYVNAKYFSLSPTATYSFTDDLFAGVQIDWVKAGEPATALAGYASWRVSQNNLFRLTVASGRTIEDAGVLDRFNSVALKYTRQLSNWRISPTLSNYQGQFRRENALSILVEVGL